MKKPCYHKTIGGGGTWCAGIEDRAASASEPPPAGGGGVDLMTRALPRDAQDDETMRTREAAEIVNGVCETEGGGGGE